MDLLEQYKKKIKKFDLNHFISRKNYKIASAISALDTSFMVIDSYINEPDSKLNQEGYILRLYALLQALFVSIDSLYLLSYAIANSKSFININNNSNLRNIRYVRNNVVGHPANRSARSDISYCILDKTRVSKNFFTYYIYTNNQEKTCSIDINEIISSYLKEAIAFLDEIYKISLKYISQSEIKILIKDVLDNYYKNGHFINELNKFIDKYKYEYPSAKKEQHRIIWRYDLVLKLDAISNKNESLNDVIKYCIGLELNKMYKHIYGKDHPKSKNLELPSMILSLYRFLNRNPEYIPYIDHLENYDDPLFFESLKELYEGVSLKKMQGAMDYLGFLITLYMGNQSEMIYAIALPISLYRVK